MSAINYNDGKSVSISALCCGCFTTTSGYIKDMEQCIPPLKGLVTENLDLFNDVYAVFCKERTPEIGLFEQDATGDIVVYVKENGSSDFVVDEMSFSDTHLLSEDEKQKIAELLNLSDESICIDSFGRGPVIIANRNLVDLRLAYLDTDEEIASVSESAHYIEELADGWYSYIIVSKPI